MSDRAYVELRLYQVAGHEQEIVELFGDWSGVFGDPHESPHDITEGVCIDDMERQLRTLHAVGPALEALGVSYIGHQTGRDEYDAEIRMFTPALGAFSATSDTRNRVTVTAEAIDDLLDRWGDDEPATRDAFDRLTGRLHREHFAGLDDLLLREDLGEPVPQRDRRALRTAGDPALPPGGPVAQMTIPAAAWRPCGEAVDPRSRLSCVVRISETEFEAVAYAVVYELPSMLQRAASEEYDDDLDAVYQVAGAQGTFDTLRVGGREYVVVLTPLG